MDGWTGEGQWRARKTTGSPASTWKVGVWNGKASPSHNYIPGRKITVSTSCHNLPGGLDPPLSQTPTKLSPWQEKHQDPHKEGSLRAVQMLIHHLRGQGIEAKTGGLNFLKNAYSMSSTLSKTVHAVPLLSGRSISLPWMGLQKLPWDCQ